MTPRQFSSRFEFDPVIANAISAGLIKDRSWGNDAMPCVEIAGAFDDGPVLWCDSIDPADSEFESVREGRYTVFDCYYGEGEPAYLGDDPAAALATLLSLRAL